MTTRRARGRGALARGGLPALGASCLIASWFGLVSCDSRFEFESPTESDGGADSGGRLGGYGGFGGFGGFGEGYGYGGLFGTGAAMGNSRGGIGNDPNDECVAKCAAAGLKCNTSSKLCVECLNNDDCPAGLSRCATAPDLRTIANRCVQCLDDEDCGKQACAPVTHTCVSRCDNADQCTVQPAAIGCSTFSGYCAGCFTETDCKNDALSHCLGKVRCGECAEDRDCLDDKLCDPVRFVCVECRTSKDCKDGQLCNRQTHACQLVTPI